MDGVIGDSNAKKYFYHTDHAGSIRVITDQDGKVVYNADYLAFGSQYSKNGDFEELHGFTGKEYDPDIGLYYFNARWYDPDLGRFISEDPAGDPNNPNLYSYCGNNPVTRTDPTGKWWQIVVYAIIGGISAERNGGDFWTGAFVGAVSGAISWGIGEGLVGAGMTEGALSTSMVSGALASGITSVAMGGDFMDGAGQGALSGLISWGVGKYLGKYAEKNKVNKYIIKGLDTELNARARGERSDPLYLILNAIIFIWDSFKENTFAIKKEALNQYDIEQAKAEYIVAAEAYEKAKASGDLDQINTWATRFNNALDRLLIASGYSQYNHTTMSFEPSKPVSKGGYIHVNVDPEIVIKAAELGKELGATSMRITEGFRTSEEFYNLYPAKRSDPKAYLSNWHCRGKALDVTYYKADGSPINKFEAAMTARNIGIPGVSIYPDKTIIHIDLRTTPINLYNGKSVKDFTTTGVIE